MDPEGFNMSWVAVLSTRVSMWVGLEEASFGEGKTKDRCTEDVVEDVDSFCSAVAGESCVSRGQIGSSVSKGSSSAVTASRAGNGCCLPCACKMELTFRILSLE